VTEQEWLTGTDPYPMLQFVRGRLTERQMRLFAVACCRSIWPLLDKPHRDVVEVAERYAEGRARGELVRARQAAWAASGFTVQHAASNFPLHAATTCALFAGVRPGGPGAADLLREIVGNPFLPVTIEPGWRTRAVIALARSIAVEERFDDLPILADALEEAGCHNRQLLHHCRQEGGHVRGCWAVDLLLAS
jgi:hypothetical protein